MFPGWVLGVLALAALPCPAQEGKTEPKALPAPVETAAEQPCMKERTYATYRLHWVERDAPPAEKLVTREVTNQEPVCTWELDWREEKHVHTELVLKPREIVKEVVCCTTEPVTTKDPVTGCRVTEWKPVRDVKLVKEIVFEACPEEKIYAVKYPYLKPVEKIYTTKRLVLESQPERRVEVHGVLVPCEVTEKILVCPPPACPQPACLK
jgi:hypothetical protein